MTERILKMRENLDQKAHISIEKHRIIQETYEKMSGEPIVKCRAQAFYNIVSYIPLYIEDGDLLAGNGSAVKGGLEIDSSNGTWNEYEVKALREDGYTFHSEDEPVLFTLNKKMPPYSMSDGISEVLSKDTNFMAFLRSGIAMVKWHNLERGRQTMQCSAQGGLNLTPAQALVCLDYELALKKGVNCMIEECNQELDKIVFDSTENYDRYIYIKSMKLCLEGLIVYANRMSEYAKKKSEKESNLQRKKELLRMAEICKRVPANPAENFREALQMYWFIFLLVACPNNALGMGRLDQLLYPYYQQDMEAGNITDDEVLELFQVLRIKDYQLGIVAGKDNRDETNGEAKWHNIVIGGVKKDGSDATNQLSYLILQALKECPTLHPTVTIRVADSTPDLLMQRGMECQRMGLSMPAFVGDKSYLEYLQLNKVPIEQARDYVLTGCIDVNLPGKSRTLNACMFITTMCLDVFLNGGKDIHSKEQIGHDYGNLDQWKSYDEFEKDFKKEFRYLISLMAQYSNLMISSMQNYFPEPAKTAFLENGIKDGVDFQIKKMFFENGGVICPVGIVNLGNSLVAIKRLVFEEKRISLTELKLAMDADWKGYEEIQKRCLSCPKYGNDIDEADQMVAEVYEWFDIYCNEMSCATGTYYRSSAVSIFGHAPGGSFTGATPDGRFYGETLADAGASPMRGQDVNGPMAMLRSALKLPHYRYQAVLMNMKIEPDVIENDIDLMKAVAMIRTFFIHGGKHIQFNIVNRETLMDAKIHPDKHKNLMVRVAGYSAYYTQLTERLQNEILDRTIFDKIG